MPKKPSKRNRKTKRSKEVVSVLKNLTKAFVNLTEIEKQKSRHSKKHSTEKSSHKRSEKLHRSHKRSEKSHRSHKLSERSHRKTSHKRSERRSHRSHKRSERRSDRKTSHKRNILHPIFRNQFSKDLPVQIQPNSNKKVSPIKIREKKKTKKKMNIFNLDKKTFINQAKLLENIKKKETDTKYKYTKKQIDDIMKRYNKPTTTQPTTTQPTTTQPTTTQPTTTQPPQPPAKPSPAKASPAKASPSKAV